MSITSFEFICFLAISLLVYYLCPKKLQKFVILISSIIFFCLASTIYTGVYVIVCILVTFLAAKAIVKGRDTAENGLNRRGRVALVLAIVIDMSILAVLKYTGMILSKPLDIAAPLGISYYTLQAIGLLVDLYWGIEKDAPSLLKTALFVGYYPGLVSGPISRANQIKDQLVEGHKLEWKNITYGIQRILWGFFKKLVIAARLGVMVDTIYANPDLYRGFYVWLAAFMFMLQLYTDFSGCMDIVLGVSEMYGIVLPENFKTPFYSETVQEFWQRWHITLGSWSRDYIMYPLLNAPFWKKFTEFLKKVFGKKASRKLSSYTAMLIVWFFIGLWHGGAWKYVIGSGLWFWLWIVIEQTCEGGLSKLANKLHIDTSAFSCKMLNRIRVFVTISVGDMFFRIESISRTLMIWKAGISEWNPSIIFDGSINKLGLTEKDVRLTICSLVVLLIVSKLQQKESVRDILARQNLVFRWGMLLILLFAVAIFGQYGLGYDAGSFLYQAF